MAARSSGPAAWDPATYLAFSEERTRPARDLISRIGMDAPARIVDLGCGAGNSTRLLAAHWPRSRVTGVDSSPEMLAAARAIDGLIEWAQADIATWAPDEPVDLVFSNAALHWLDGHDTLFPRLVSYLNTGGELAVQMPRNDHAPTHQAIAEIARRRQWKDTLAPLLNRPPVDDPEVHFERLSTLTSSLDVWETTYWHVLDGENPVVDWTKGTVLRPFLEALPETEQDAFVAVYAKRMASAYLRSATGKTLFPFRRLFIVARR